MTAYDIVDLQPETWLISDVHYEGVCVLEHRADALCHCAVVDGGRGGSRQRPDITRVRRLRNGSRRRRGRDGGSRSRPRCGPLVRHPGVERAGETRPPDRSADRRPGTGRLDAGSAALPWRDNERRGPGGEDPIVRVRHSSRAAADRRPESVDASGITPRLGDPVWAFRRHRRVRARRPRQGQPGSCRIPGYRRGVFRPVASAHASPTVRPAPAAQREMPRSVRPRGGPTNGGLS